VCGEPVARVKRRFSVARGCFRALIVALPGGAPATRVAASRRLRTPDSSLATCHSSLPVNFLLTSSQDHSTLPEKNPTTIFQIKTFTAIRLFQQAFHFLRFRDQIVHFVYLALRE